ncbi:MAG: fdhE [Tardiphaga sp.]|nr:fdhE [Tardiphaga sp.]
MSKIDSIQPDPTAIGNVAEPPFARLPDPATLFEVRAERLQALSAQHELAPFLRFLSGLSWCQHRLQDGLPDPELPSEEERQRARAHAMPPLGAGRFTADAAFDATLDRLLRLAADIEMPAAAKAALTRVSEADATTRTAMARAVLAYEIPAEDFAGHIFVAAALQVYYARLAAALDVKQLVPVGDGVCPACGGAPVATMVVGWLGAHGSRFCACSVCATQWNYVRIKCTLCSSTAGISYQEIEGGDGTIWGETCRSCQGYVKILHQHKNPALDPVADDVASLALDLLLREDGFRRGGVNPFLLGY